MGLPLGVYLLVGIPLGIVLFVPLVLYARWLHRRAPSYIDVIHAGRTWIHWKLSGDAWRWYLARRESREGPRTVRIANRALFAWMGCLLFSFVAVSCTLLLLGHGFALQTELSLLRQLGSLAVLILLSLALGVLWIKAEGLVLRRARGEVLITSAGILIPGYHCIFANESGQAGSSIADARVTDARGLNCLWIAIRTPWSGSRSGADMTVLEIPIPVGCETEAQEAAEKMLLLDPRNRAAVDADQEVQ